MARAREHRRFSLRNLGLTLAALLTLAAVVPPASAADDDERLTFSEVSLATSVEAEGFTRSITYAVAGHAHYSSSLAKHERFIDSLAAAGATVERSSTQDEDRWVVTFSAATADELLSWTNRALRTERAVFEVERAEPSADASGPGASGSLRIRNYAECPRICFATVGLLVDELTPPLGWQLELAVGPPAQQDPSGVVTYRLLSPAPTLLLTGPPRFASVRSALTLGLTGAVSWRGDFLIGAGLPAEDAHALRTLLGPATGATTGPVEVVAAPLEDGTLVVVRIDGPSVGEFLGEYRAWSGDLGSGLDREREDGADLLVDRDRIEVDLGFAPAVEAHLPAGGIEQTVSVALGRTVTASDAGGPASGARASTVGGRVVVVGPAAPFTVVVQGPSSVALGLGVVLVVAVTVAVVRVVRKRRAAARLATSASR